MLQNVVILLQGVATQQYNININRIVFRKKSVKIKGNLIRELIKIFGFLHAVLCVLITKYKVKITCKDKLSPCR